MIGLLLLFFIGRSFYKLSEEHNKNKWLFAILGIATYYAGAFIGGIFLGIIDLISGTNYTESLSNLILGLLAIPFGLFFCWGFYKILKSQWSRITIKNPENLLDSNMTSE